MADSLTHDKAKGVTPNISEEEASPTDGPPSLDQMNRIAKKRSFCLWPENEDFIDNVIFPNNKHLMGNYSRAINEIIEIVRKQHGC